MLRDINILDWEDSEIDNDQVDISEESLHSVLMLEQGEWAGTAGTEESPSDLMLVVPHAHQQQQQEPNYSIAALPSNSFTQLALPPPSTSQETHEDVEMTVAVSNAVQVVEGKLLNSYSSN